MSIPLNMIDLPGGSSSVDVNGSRADFSLDTVSSASSSLITDTTIVKGDIQVDDVSIEVGVGSPIPVHAIVSGTLPSACAHLGEIRLHRDGATFFVQLLSYTPAQTDCNPDTLPFRLTFSLNIVNSSRRTLRSECQRRNRKLFAP